MKMKRWIIGVTAIIMTGFVLPGNKVKADTADIVIYDASEFETFQSRTKEEIGRKYGEALYAGESYEDKAQNTYYERMYSLEDPYDAGKLTEDTHKTMTAMTDFYRWLVGVEPLTVSSEHSDKLQAEALVRNFEFNHSVSDTSKPEDMSQEFWDYGAKDSIHTILARYTTPRNSITSWMNEGYNLSYELWDTVGHRYALIGSTVSDLQFGYAGSIAAGQERAYENTMNIPFSAYPAPGYMPTNLMYSGSSAWSIEINQENLAITDSSSVVVRVTNLDTSETYECTTANRKLQISSYGSILSFVQPAPVSGSRYTGSYRVEVNGLTDVDSGKDAMITYTTEFFDPTEYTPSYVKTVTVDGIEKYNLYKTTATTENLQKIAYTLPSEVTVVAENGRREQIPVTGKWVLNEEEQCWTNQADTTKLPEDITDREHVLEKCAIYYEISNIIYVSWDFLNIYPSEPEQGDAGGMYVFLSQTSEDTSIIFQLVPQEDGTYVGRKKYDSRSSKEFEETESGDHVYNISSFQESDAGEYFSISYDSSSTCAYVSYEFLTLTVSNPEQSGGDQKNPDGTEGGTVIVSEETLESGTAGNGGSKQAGSGNSIAGNVRVSPGIKISKVKKFKATAKKRAIVLTWKKNLRISGYQIQISTKKNFKGAKKISLKKSKSKYKVSKLKPDKKYYVRIRAYQSYKDQSGKTKKVYGKWTVKSGKARK